MPDHCDWCTRPMTKAYILPERVTPKGKRFEQERVCKACLEAAAKHGLHNNPGDSHGH